MTHSRSSTIEATDTLGKLLCIAEHIYERERARALKSHPMVPWPEHVDARFDEAKQIYERVLELVEEANARLQKEVMEKGT